MRSKLRNVLELKVGVLMFVVPAKWSNETDHGGRTRGTDTRVTVCADIVNNYFFKPRPNCNRGYN